MNNKASKLWLIPSFLIILITLTTLCVSNNSNDDKKYENFTSDEQLELFYLGANYLLPDPPGSSSTNITELPAMAQKSFGTSIFDRKFNNALIPELHLWLDAHGNNGIELEFEIFFQAVENNAIIPDNNFKALFTNYTTTGTTNITYLNVSFLKYEGEPFDIKPGTENLCHVTLTIKRIDNNTNSKLHIYHGAENKTSFIKVPYDQTYSAYEYEREQDKDKDKKSTPGFIVGQLVLVIGGILLLKKLRN